MSADSTKWNPLSLFLIGILSRIPFIFNGFGKEEDAWAQIQNAKYIAENNVYEVSRLPGHPVFELLFAQLWDLSHQAYVFNGLIALVSALCLSYFYKILMSYGFRHAFYIAIILNFIPVFFIAGTYAIDYNFALLFILGSWWELIKKRYWLAGILLGIACGIRISSLGFLAVLLFLDQGYKLNKQNVTFILSSIFVSILCYSLPFKVYSWAFLDFHKPPAPSLTNILYKLSFGIWGIPLFFAAILSSISFIRLYPLVQLDSKKKLLLSAILALGLQLLIFARLPFKSEFFIPALPFILILFAMILSFKQAKRLALISVISCFTFGFDYSNNHRGANASNWAFKMNISDKSIFLDPINGPVQIDQSKRSNKSAYVEKITNWLQEKEYSVYLVGGWYWPELDLKYKSELHDLDYYAEKDEILNALSEGKEVYFLPEIREANQKIYNHSLLDSLGQELVLE